MIARLGVDKGIACPKCKCNRLRVIYVRPDHGGRIRRRRECKSCGHRVTTWESGGHIAGRRIA